MKGLSTVLGGGKLAYGSAGDLFDAQIVDLYGADSGRRLGFTQSG